MRLASKDLIGAITVTALDHDTLRSDRAFIATFTPLSHILDALAAPLSTKAPISILYIALELTPSL